MLHYEDMVVGDRTVIGSYRITRDEIIEFARRFDPQPFHVDEAAGRASIYGGLTASSAHTFALMALIEHRSGRKGAYVANLGAEHLRFPAPLRPDDEVTLTSEVVAARVSRSRPEIGLVTTEGNLVNQRGEVVMEMRGTIMIRRRAAARG